MKYAGMPMGMWMIFHKSFQRNLTEVLKYDEEESRKITALAKKKYREHGTIHDIHLESVRLLKFRKSLYELSVLFLC